MLVQGGESFRPIALAAAPDGAVFFTDWVDASYNVHGKGRIWKLQNKEATKPGKPLVVKPSAERRRMNELADGKLRGVVAALADKDQFIRSAAITTLSQPVLRDEISSELKSASADTRLGVLLALRRGNAGKTRHDPCGFHEGFAVEAVVAGRLSGNRVVPNTRLASARCSLPPRVDGHAPTQGWAA